MRWRSCQRCLGQVEWGGQNKRDKRGCQFHRLFINTWNVVQSNWVLSVGTVLSFLSPQRCIKIQKSPVCFCWFLQTPERPGLAGWRGEVNFFTLYRGIYYFLVASETKCLLYRILGVGDGKKNKKKNQESETKKVVVPNTTMQMPPHHRHFVLVEVQVLGKVDHRNNGQMETCRIRNEGSDFSEKWH